MVKKEEDVVVKKEEDVVVVKMEEVKDEGPTGASPSTRQRFPPHPSAEAAASGLRLRQSTVQDIVNAGHRAVVATRTRGDAAVGDAEVDMHPNTNVPDAAILQRAIRRVEPDVEVKKEENVAVKKEEDVAVKKEDDVAVKKEEGVAVASVDSAAFG